MTKELTIIKELQPVANEALTIKVKSHGDMLVATDLLSRLNQLNDRIQDEKERVTKPLNEALKAERSRWKHAEAFYEEAIKNVRNEMTAYQTKLVTEQRKKEQAIADKLTAGSIDMTKAVKQIEKIKTPDKEIATESGLVQFVETKKFEVMDVTFLPVEYIMANEELIRKALKEGVELPGVRYYTEMVPRNYR